MEYTQFLVMWNSVRGLTWKRYLQSQVTCEYCPDIIWTTYLLDYFGSAFDIGQTYYDEFLGIILYHPIQISGTQCYVLWEVVAMEVVC